MAASTGEAIRTELKKYGLIRVLGAPTATGTTSRLRDATRLVGAAALPSTAFNGCQVRISTTGGVAAGYQTFVDYLDQDLGDLYVSPLWDVAPTTAARYEIWRQGIDPDDVDRLRDEALTSICSQWGLFPVSLVTNPNWEVDTTNWDAGASATLARQGGTFPTEVWRATLLVTNDGSTVNGRAESLAITALQPGDRFYLYVPVSVRAGTATVVVRDITAGANVTLSGTATSTRRGWTGIEVTGSIPTGSDSIEIWLRGDEATAIVEWGPVFFHKEDARRMQLEARVDSREKVGPVYGLTNYPVQTSPDFGDEKLEEIMGVNPKQVNDAVFLQFDNPMTGRPYMYDERIYYTALSATYLTAAARAVGDAATTLCPLDYAAAATAKLIAEAMLIKAPHEADFYAGVLQLAENRLSKFERLYGPEQKGIQTRERTISVPYLRV